MPFSRGTLIHTLEILNQRIRTHADFDIFLIRFGLENIAPSSLGGLQRRGAALLKHLVAHPQAQGPCGSNLAYEIVEYLLTNIQQGLSRNYGRQTIEDIYPELVNSLRQDGFVIENGRLVRSLPEELHIADSRDEIHRLLVHFSFRTAAGHLDQAIAAHARGEWASANANLRTYMESLFDDIAHYLWPTEARTRGTSHGRRELLAQGHNGEHPFFLTDLNEWVIGNRGGFIHGVWKRLQPQGSHPGLSDEEDSTFRLHLVFLLSRHLLRRLMSR